MAAELNQTPEQKARDNIDTMLIEAGWHVQNKDQIDFNAGLGIAVREYQTDVGPADYVLFVDKQAVGVIEAIPAPNARRGWEWASGGGWRRGRVRGFTGCLDA